MKPKTSKAMASLLCQIRQSMPLDHSDIHLCRKSCNGCPKKLVQFIRGEVEHWEWALSQGEVPRLGDVGKLATTSQKIYKALLKNGVVRKDS